MSGRKKKTVKKGITKANTKDLHFHADLESIQRSARRIICPYLSHQQAIRSYIANTALIRKRSVLETVSSSENLRYKPSRFLPLRVAQTPLCTNQSTLSTAFTLRGLAILCLHRILFEGFLVTMAYVPSLVLKYVSSQHINYNLFLATICTRMHQFVMMQRATSTHSV